MDDLRDLAGVRDGVADHAGADDGGDNGCEQAEAENSADKLARLIMKTIAQRRLTG